MAENKPNYLERIREADEKLGLDLQELRDLHSYLCSCEEAGAYFAAVVVRQAIEHAYKAKTIISELSSLAS